MQSVKICGWVESAPGHSVTNKKRCFSTEMARSTAMLGFLRNIDDFELIDGVAEAIRQINTLGWLAVVVTNQPVIARGEVSPEELDQIHCKMETLLGQQGAYLDAIYYCPHHPDKGYPRRTTGTENRMHLPETQTWNAASGGTGSKYRFDAVVDGGRRKKRC